MQTFLPKNEGLLCVLKQYTNKTLRTLFYGSQRQHSMFAIKLKLHIYRNKTNTNKFKQVGDPSESRAAMCSTESVVLGGLLQFHCQVCACACV